MNFLDHLEKARTEIGLGHLFEASEHLSKASEWADRYGSEFQAGIDAVASLHSKIERMIASLEVVAQRMDSQVVPRWQKVVISELREPKPVERSTPIPKIPKRIEPLGGSPDDEGPFSKDNQDE